jgi:hypothetical protein
MSRIELSDLSDYERRLIGNEAIHTASLGEWGIRQVEKKNMADTKLMGALRSQGSSSLLGFMNDLDLETFINKQVLFQARCITQLLGNDDISTLNRRYWEVGYGSIYDPGSEAGRSNKDLYF